MLRKLQQRQLLAGAGEVLLDAVRYVAIMVVLVVLLQGLRPARPPPARGEPIPEERRVAEQGRQSHDHYDALPICARARS